jgi:putative transposase
MRKRRELLKGATYHVTSKINRDAMELGDEKIKKMLLGFIKKAKKKFRIKIWNFSLMDNHIHFLVKPLRSEEKGYSLSDMMQWLKCNFARAWNKLHGTTGHLWGERFFSKIVQDEEAFTAVDNYIDQNPVKAGLVEKAADWAFGGLYYRLSGIGGLIDTVVKIESLVTIFKRPYAAVF